MAFAQNPRVKRVTFVRGETAMYDIIASFQRLAEAITPVEWACILALFVFLIVLGRTGYFFVLAAIGGMAWVIRDLGHKASLGAYQPWILSCVIVFGVAYGVYMIYHHMIRSG